MVDTDGVAGFGVITITVASPKDKARISKLAAAVDSPCCLLSRFGTCLAQSISDFDFRVFFGIIAGAAPLSREL